MQNLGNSNQYDCPEYYLRKLCENDDRPMEGTR